MFFNVNILLPNPKNSYIKAYILLTILYSFNKYFLVLYYYSLLN